MSLYKGLTCALILSPGVEATVDEDHGGISVAAEHDQDLLRRRQQQHELRLLCHAGVARLHGGEAESHSLPNHHRSSSTNPNEEKLAHARCLLILRGVILK